MTDQFKAWRGAFGDEYTERCQPDELNIRARRHAWARMLRCVNPAPLGVLDVGCNAGANGRALQSMVGVDVYGIEPNNKARIIAEPFYVEVRDGSAKHIPWPEETFDLVFTMGVLIHVHPDDIEKACKEMLRVSKKWLLVVEYFSHDLTCVQYRGLPGMLWKRDFGRFIYENFYVDPIDYGFFWKPVSGLDNLTWWLFRKEGS